MGIGQPSGNKRTELETPFLFKTLYIILNINNNFAASKAC